MVQLAGKYIFSEGENIAKFLVSMGQPEEHAKHANDGVSLEVHIDGEKLTLTSTITGKTIVTNLELGKDVDYETTSGSVIKNHATLAGNILTIDCKIPDGKSVQRQLTFSDAGVEEILCSSDGKTKARVVFKRV